MCFIIKEKLGFHMIAFPTIVVLLLCSIVKVSNSCQYVKNVMSNRYFWEIMLISNITANVITMHEKCCVRKWQFEEFSENYFIYWKKFYLLKLHFYLIRCCTVDLYSSGFAEDEGLMVVSCRLCFLRAFPFIGLILLTTAGV